MHSNSNLLITTSNPLWGRILELAEKLKLKMPEGPHKWASKKDVTNALISNNLKILKSENVLLLPIHITILSHIANKVLGNIPIIKKFGLIQVVIAKIRN